MKNTVNNGANAGAQTELEDDDIKIVRVEKVESLKKSIFKFFGYLVLMIIGLVIYYQWQRIPIKKHYFQFECIASPERLVKPVDTTCNFFAEITFVDPKNIDVGFKGFRWNEKVEDIMKTQYAISYSSSFYKKTKPIYSNYSGHLSDVIGSAIYDELNEYYQNKDVDIDEYCEVFYFRHLDDDDILEKKMDNYRFKRNRKDWENYFKKQVGISCIPIYEKRRTADSYYFVDSLLPIDTEFENNVDFKNFSQSYWLARKGEFCYLSSNMTTYIPSRLLRFIVCFFRMEDISQSYYFIRLQSETMPISLKMEFIGTISCIIDGKQKLFVDVDEDRSSFVITKDFGSHGDQLVLVKFNDMENLQTFRLFLLAAVITLLLTKWFKMGIRIVGNIRTNVKQRKGTPRSSVGIGVGQEDVLEVEENN